MAVGAADEDEEANACDRAFEKNESLIRLDGNGAAAVAAAAAVGAVAGAVAGAGSLDVDDVGADDCCGLR